MLPFVTPWAICRRCKDTYEPTADTDVPICDECYQVERGDDLSQDGLDALFERYGFHGDDVPISAAGYRRNLWARAKIRKRQRCQIRKPDVCAGKVDEDSGVDGYVDPGLDGYMLRPISEGGGVVRHQRICLPCAEKLAREGLLAVKDRSHYP